MNKLEDIAKLTGLKEAFLRRCIGRYQKAFEPHTKRGDKNSLLFDDNAVVLFDKIKQLKEKGLNLNEIDKEINMINSKTNKHSETEHPNIDDTLLKIIEEKVVKHNKDKDDRVIELYDKLLEEREKRLTEKEEVIDNLKKQILMLTDGKTIEEVKEEENKKRQRANRQAEIITELDMYDGKLFAKSRRKALLVELRELNIKG